MQPGRLTILIIILAGLAAGCASTNPERSSRDRSPATTDTAGVETTSSSRMQQILDQFRSRLSDVYATQQHDLPPEYLNDSVRTESATRNPFDGFRIQIVSSLNVAAADSVSRSFRLWADSTIAGYEARTYVFFKQPYYKVHVGDFHDRSRAINFSRIIKRQFPDAWVVPDRINPTRTPADTTNFGYK